MAQISATASIFWLEKDVQKPLSLDHWMIHGDSEFSMYGILCLHVGDLCWANVGVHIPGPWFALEGILLGFF